MKKNFINAERIEGRLYQHNLEIKKVQNKDSKNFGKDFISGTIDVATDEDGLNVIPVHFTYVTEMTSGGKKNVTYGVLENIINGAKTWVTDGKDAALKVRVNTALGLNDFYDSNENLVSAKRNEGGFVNTIKDLAPENERNTFDFDFVLTSVGEVESEDENEDTYVRLKGAIFNFRKDLLPVELICRDKGGMDYFISLDASPSNPIFTEVKGRIVSNSIVRKIEEESAFGSASVKTVTRTVREWQVTWARPTEYAFGEEDTITAADLQEAMQNREVMLAENKKRHDDYVASRGTTSTPAPAANKNIPVGGFNF